jgi:hypothetical protein
MWQSLLTEPKAVLGPYCAKAPSLNSFAPHSWRVDFNHVSVAGQFLELPLKPPDKWLYADTYRAYAVFEFSDVRKLEVVGMPNRSEQDDSLHLEAVGIASSCQLEELSEIWLDNPESGVKMAWRRFGLVQTGFSLELEAQHVMIYLGRQAIRQYGWQREV